MEGGVPKICRLLLTRSVYMSFFNIITYFFNICKPVGPRFTGKYNAYDRSLEVVKKLHMGEPIGDTGFCGRWRPAKAYRSI